MQEVRVEAFREAHAARVIQRGWHDHRQHQKDEEEVCTCSVNLHDVFKRNRWTACFA